jgi:hypothetical protein
MSTKGTIVPHEFGEDVCYYEKLEDDKVRCLACAHHCVLADGKYGIFYGHKN